MQNTAAVCADISIPSACIDGNANNRSFEYLSVREAAQLFNKCESRLYEMVADGLLEEVGLRVLRTERGRIWVVIPRSGFSRLKLKRKELT
jgi:hypothetical protein